MHWWNQWMGSFGSLAAFLTWSTVLSKEQESSARWWNALVESMDG